MFTRAHGSLTLPEASTLGGGLISPFGAFFLRLTSATLPQTNKLGSIHQLGWDFLRYAKSRWRRRVFSEKRLRRVGDREKQPPVEVLSYLRGT